MATLRERNWGLFLQTKVPEYNKTQHPQYGKIRDPNWDQGDFVFEINPTNTGSVVTNMPKPTPQVIALLTQGTVTGKVVDESGKSVSGANITLTGDREYTDRTGFDGSFKITASEGRYPTLEINKTGYLPRSYNINLMVMGGGNYPVSQSITLFFNGTKPTTTSNLENPEITEILGIQSKIRDDLGRVSSKEMITYLGKSVVLEVSVSANTREIPAPTLPNISGLGFSLKEEGVSTQIINGKVIYSRIFYYPVTANEIGNFEIFPIFVNKGKDKETANLVKLKVVSTPEELQELLPPPTSNKRNLFGSFFDFEKSQKTKTFDLGGGIKLEMVLIPSGSFMMGSDEYFSEKPIHEVNISNSYWMGKYEVTQEQWQAVMGNNPSGFKGSGNLPVEQVSWNDIQDFLGKLNQKISGGGFRLPSEAEWEYACRAGSTTKYSFGESDSSIESYAWYNSNSGSKTQPVGGKSPNQFGLYDMYGNVWEWCQDWYQGSYNGAPTDGSAWEAQSGTCRVLRGGCWGRQPWFCRSASRLWDEPVSRYCNFGFRVVRADSF